MTRQPLLIYGSRDYAQLVAHIASDCGFAVSGFIDDQAQGPQVLGTYHAVVASHPPAHHALALGIGYNNLPARHALLQRCLADGWQMPPLVHPQSIVHASAKIGAGAVVMLGAILDVNARLGEGAVCWPGSIVSHDATLGDNSFLSPNATLCGFVQTGHSCFFGAASVVTDRVLPPNGFFLKAGERCSKPRHDS